MFHNLFRECCSIYWYDIIWSVSHISRSGNDAVDTQARIQDRQMGRPDKIKALAPTGSITVTGEAELFKRGVNPAHYSIEPIRTQVGAPLWRASSV